MIMNTGSELRLRLVFDEAVATFPLAVDSNWEDIADILASITPDRHGPLLVIDVQLPALSH